MDAKLLISALVLAGTLTSCGGDDAVVLENEFQLAYQLSEFNLSKTYRYWEIRRGSVEFEESDEYEVIVQFDATAYNGLVDDIKSVLSDAQSQNGFFAQCLPSYCPIYGAAISDQNDVELIDSNTLLKAFFGDIDTEAELFIWVKYSRLSFYNEPLSYEAYEQGYKVVVEWDTLCQRKGSSLIYVDQNGDITELKQLTEEHYDSCA